MNTINDYKVGCVVSVKFGNEFDVGGAKFSNAKILQVQERLLTVYLVEEIDDQGVTTGVLGTAVISQKETWDNLEGVDMNCTNAREVGSSFGQHVWTRESAILSLGFSAE